MKKKTPPAARRAAMLSACLLLAACLLTGCAALLERSYSVVEPYADRYWDSSAEDTLQVENYPDLVTSLLLLIEQRAEEGVIRCYGESSEFQNAMAAREEVRLETTLGSYLLRDIRLSHESGTNYSTITCRMTYRKDAEDINSIMTLSDSQSLVDLLRLTVREEREKLTVRFSYDMPREDVTAAVENLWQELCRSEMEENETLAGDPDQPPAAPEDGEETGGAEAADGTDAEEPPPEEAPQEEGTPDGAPEEGSPEDPEEEPPEEPEEEPVVYPPCPWLIRFYPNQETAEIVEVLLRK